LTKKKLSIPDKNYNEKFNRVKLLSFYDEIGIEKLKNKFKNRENNK
jgi:hypothetical protein